MKKILGLLMVCSLIVVCEDDYEHNPITETDVKPNTVSNVKVVPIRGGFDISYDLPTNKDVLYVKAVYSNSKGEEVEVKSSVYTDKMQILGFGNTEKRTVSLYTVNRSNKISESVSFSESPLTPPITLIQNKMTISQDFGGANFKWTNEEKKPVIVMLLAEGKDKRLKVVETIYSSQSEANFLLRGREPTPQKFAALIRDRYDNFSDTIYPVSANKLITPLLEERLDKKLFKEIFLPGDSTWDNYGKSYSNFYDDNIDTSINGKGRVPLPHIYSLDLGVTVKLSRFILFQRNKYNNSYKYGNFKRYKVYGVKELPEDSGNLDNWIFLRECETGARPSGRSYNTDEDKATAKKGHEFTFDNAPEIRYFRLVVTETFSGSTYTQAAEITLWGDVVN